MDYLLQLDAIECRHGGRPVVRDLSLRMRPGSFVCLLGPSGCGKTTALRAIAGFEPVHRGTIHLREEPVSAPGLCVEPERRRLGMVFQDYALFPHLTVLENVTFGLHGQRRARRREAGLALLDLVGLTGLAWRYPHELSGGQQQRVALARAMAPDPDLILLDEPFSSLDVELRERLACQVHDILRSRGIGAVLVTHDQLEAFAVAEQVGVMREGRLVQWDSPYNLYHEPADRFVADFIGQGRFIRGTLLSPDVLETEAGTIRGNRAFLWPPGTALDVLLRPDDVVPDPAGSLRATIVNKAFKGAETLYTLRLDSGLELLSLFPSHQDHPVNERVGVRVEPEHLVAFATASQG